MQCFQCRWSPFFNFRNFASSVTQGLITPSPNNRRILLKDADRILPDKLVTLHSEEMDWAWLEDAYPQNIITEKKLLFGSDLVKIDDVTQLQNNDTLYLTFQH